MEETPTGFDAFPEEVRDDVEGLTWLGHLETTTEYAGHTFVLRTLKLDEELFAALLTKEYQESLGQAKAWATANIALALKSVDAKTDWCPKLGPNYQENARGKFNFISRNWYWPTIQHLYEEFIGLIAQQLKALDEVKSLSLRSQQDSWPSADSSTDQADSKSEKIMDLLDSTSSSTPS